LLDPADGYRIEVEERPEVSYYETNPKRRHYKSYIVRAFDKNGVWVGSVDFGPTLREKGLPDEVSLEAGAVVVEEGHRRRGIATAMYQAVRQTTGRKIVASGSRTKAGKALWEGSGQYFGALTSNADLDKFRFVFRKKQDGVKLSVYDGKKLIGVVGAITEGYCYPDDSPLAKYRKPANVVSAEILPEYRGRKLYQEMLLRFNQFAKQELGCKGIKSAGFQRSTMATRAWEKLNPRVEIASDGWRNDFYLDGLPPRGRIPLAGAPTFSDLTFESRVKLAAPGNPSLLIVRAVGPLGFEAGEASVFLDEAEYAPVFTADVHPKYRGRGLYPAMLMQLLRNAKERGYRGIVSEDAGRVGTQSTASWEKFAAREPRVRRGKDAFTLEGLPARGRIPLPTARRALNRLGRKAKACGITPALLREGMEIEREHRDITGGRVLQTAKIAAAHICERRDYYKRIKRFVEK
jgi:GNAT superfamily N-acetyltransferase